MNNIWMINHDHIEWVANFLKQSVQIDVEQFMLSKGAKQVAPLMTVDKKGIATIPVMGPLAPMPHAVMKMFGGTSTIELKKSFEQVANSSRIKGVIMPTNSPGGNNAMIDETAALIHEVAKNKPVLAHTIGQNGSASYYVTSQANKIFAQNRTNQIGSIGTRLVVPDVSEAMEKAGIKNIVIDTGENKTIGQGKKVTEGQQEYLRGIVNHLQDFFEETVQRGRPGIDIKQVNDGSIFLANVAQQKGLIDGIDSMEGTRARLEAMIQ